MKKTTKKRDLYIEILKLLGEIHTSNPSINIGSHLATALEEYQDLWGVPDSEILYAIQKYKATLEYDVAPRETSDLELEQILKDGMNLSITLEED